MSNTRIGKIKKRMPFAFISQIVVDALRKLKRPSGCTIEAIKTFIKNLHGRKSQLILEKIPLVLQRGVVFGAIKMNNDNYKLDSVMVMAARRPAAQPVRLAPKTITPAQRSRQTARNKKRSQRNRDAPTLPNRKRLMN